MVKRKLKSETMPRPSNEEIRDHYQTTQSYAVTGRKFGLSRQRIHQIVTGYTSYKPNITKKFHRNRDGTEISDA
jgi:hypothetical protein